MKRARVLAEVLDVDAEHDEALVAVPLVRPLQDRRLVLARARTTTPRS